MKIPIQQQIFRLVLWLLVGFLALGNFLNAINNANSLISPPITIIGSIVILLLWVAIEFSLKKGFVLWVVSGQKHRLRGLGVRTRVSIVGAIVLLWVPRIFDLAGTPSSVSNSPHPNTSNTPTPGVSDRLSTSTITSNVTSTTYAQAVLKDSPDLYYRFNDLSTVVFDSSASKPPSNGQYVNNVVHRVGIFGSGGDQAATFEGDGYISRATLPEMQNSADRTIELWFRASQKDESAGLLQTGTGNGPGESMILGITKQDGLGGDPPVHDPGFYVGFHGSDVFMPILNLEDHNWHYVAVTVHEGMVSVFIDGKQQPQGYLYNGCYMRNLHPQPFKMPIPPRTLSSLIEVGKQVGGSDFGNFYGDIAELAIYPQALTAEQVTTHYHTSGRAPIPMVPPPTPTYESPVSGTQEGHWYVTVDNIDDVGEVSLNAVTVISTSTSTTTTEDITDKMKPGDNTLKLSVFNYFGGYAWGFYINHGNKTVWYDKDGINGQHGACNNDESRQQQIVYTQTLTIRPDGAISEGDTK